MSDEKLNNHGPLVSIITVCYNAGQTIAPTLDSVRSQTAVDFEHIVMDGVSNDSTLRLVDELKTDRTRVFSSPDKGIYDAMNKALGVANGRYVLFLNAGDRFFDDNTLQRYIDVIHKTDMPGVVYGQTVLVDGDNTVLGPRHLTAPDQLTLDSFKTGMVVCHQAFMALKTIAPLYDTRYRFSADYEWCIRCLQHSRRNVYLGDEPVIRYLSEGMTTRNHRKSLMERFRIMSVYYGLFPTIGRHIGFAFRYLGRRNKSVNNQ